MNSIAFTLIAVAGFVLFSASVMLAIWDQGKKRRKQRERRDRDDEQW